MFTSPLTRTLRALSLVVCHRAITYAAFAHLMGLVWVDTTGTATMETEARQGEEQEPAGGSGLGNVVNDEGRIRNHLDKVVLETVEQTLNRLLDVEADRLCGEGRYERSAGRVDTRAGHYERKLGTKAGEVTLRNASFETAIIGRYPRRSWLRCDSRVDQSLWGSVVHARQ